MLKVILAIVAAVVLTLGAPFLAPEPAASADAGFAPERPIAPGIYGYEPSIRVGDDGALYVTAHKQEATDGTRLASWLWYSLDDAQTWRSFKSPHQIHESQFALEGEFALDDEGRIYFVDTYLADQSFSVWRATEDGPAWEHSRPVQGTLSLDDRPWMDAHGDGVVYLVSNHGPDAPSHHSILSDDPVAGDRIWLHVSEDRGMTWEARAAFSGAWWCGIAASKVDDHTVYVGCFTPSWLKSNIRQNYLGETVQYVARMYKSEDRGLTWEETHLKDYQTRNGPLYPKPATDTAGNAYHNWIDDFPTDALPGVVHVAREKGDAWGILDVTPFRGTFMRIWAEAGSEGTLALTFYATPDVPPKPSSAWHAYALVTRDAQAPTPEWTLSKLSDAPVASRDDAPRDFFQVAVGPDDRIHVVFERIGSVGSSLFYTSTAG